MNACTRKLEGRRRRYSLEGCAKCDSVFQADEPEMRQFDDLRRPVVQHAAESRCSRGRTNTDDRQVATAIVTVELKKGRIARFTVNPDLRLGTRRAAWPISSGLDSRLLVRRWPRSGVSGEFAPPS